MTECTLHNEMHIVLWEVGWNISGLYLDVSQARWVGRRTADVLGGGRVLSEEGGHRDIRLPPWLLHQAPATSCLGAGYG